MMFLLVSCSVKEARENCPCRLEISLEECLPLTKELTLSAWGDGRVFTDALTVADCPRPLVRMVPKGFVKLTALSGIRTAELAEGDWILPRGSACDSIWTYSAEVDCRDEITSVLIMLKQQFATVHLSIIDLDPATAYPYRLLVRSQVDGLTIPDCAPHEGEWTRSLMENESGEYVFRIPRQRDGSLSLDLALDGRKVESYPIGEHIVRSGYDWKADRLEDIYIGMDYGGISPVITIEKWKDGDIYESVI